MAVIVSDSSNPFYTGNLSADGGFYRAEYWNLGCISNTVLVTSVQRNIDVSFGNVGNCQGIILGVYSLVTNPSSYKGITVTLQENVASVWTDRTAKTLTVNEINPEASLGGPSYFCSFVPFKFEMPYAVDTSAGKWRFKVLDSCIGLNPGLFALTTSNATNPSFVTWCDTSIKATDGDNLIVADKVIIDSSIIINASYGWGETTMGIAGWICRSKDPSTSGICLLEWQNPPSQSYTVTLGGTIFYGSLAGFRVGSSASRIPFAQQAVINRKTTVDYGSATIPGFRHLLGTTAALVRGRGALFLHGEIPVKSYGVLDKNAASAQARFYLTEDVSGYWKPNDTVYLGKQNVRGQGDLTWYTISSVDASCVTLTGNIATNTRLAGGTVVNSNGYGIRIEGAATTYFAFILENPNYFEISGCRMTHTYITTYSATSYHMYVTPLEYTGKFIFEDNLSYTTNTTPVYPPIQAALIPRHGISMQRNKTVRNCLFSLPYAYASTNPTYARTAEYPGLFEFKDNKILSNYNNAAFTASLYSFPLQIENNSFENAAASTPFLYITGQKTTFKNNVIWGNATAYTAGGAVAFQWTWDPVSMNNYFDNNACAIGWIGRSGMKNLKSYYDKFGTEVANLYDLSFYSDLYYAYNFDAQFIYPSVSTNGTELTVQSNWISSLSPTSYIGIHGENGKQNADRTFNSYGVFTRCGSGLTDTTVHTAGSGKYSLRFDPTNIRNPLSFSQYIPIGDNMVGKPLSISSWIKINDASYYYMHHENPTMTVTYDTSQLAIAVATDTTDWQQLSVNFTPQTPYNIIQLEFRGQTDASGNLGYFYVDDVNLTLPDNTTMNFGNIDTWSGGLPTTPFIPISNIEPNAGQTNIYSSTLYSANIY